MEPTWTSWIYLSAEMVALMSAKNDFSINLSVLKTARQIEKQMIDLLA